MKEVERKSLVKLGDVTDEWFSHHEVFPLGNKIDIISDCNLPYCSYFMSNNCPMTLFPSLCCAVHGTVLHQTLKVG